MFRMCWMAKLYYLKSRGLKGQAGNLSGCLWIILKLSDKGVRKRYRPLWWLWRHVYKDHDAPEEISGKSQSKCHLDRDHGSRRIIFSLTLKTRQRFINLISQFLPETNCPPTYHAEDDADGLIVKTAVESVRERNYVAGDGTNLLRCHKACLVYGIGQGEALKRYADLLHFRE